MGNLPAELSSFVGRRQEVAAARRLLSSTRLLTLTGPGGVGKTQLALRVARQSRRAFADGVWLVELAALQDPALLTQAVADALGLRAQSTRVPLAVVVDHLRDKQLLLVLDNCEHLVQACCVMVAKLLGAAGRLRILATSRQLLRVEGEYVLPVGPLSVPDPERLPPDRNVHTYEAVRLLTERAAAVVPGFEVNAGNRAAVVGICHRLDGMPLAIELAAARMGALSPDQILRRLDDRFRLLVTGSRVVLPRHQTLRATIDWSFDLCTPEEQALWAQASVFAGGFDLDAAEAVCDGGIDRWSVFELVTGLVDKSILVREDHSLHARYRMLDTIRYYGRDRLRETGEQAELRERHRDYYLELAERSDTAWFGPHQVEVFRRTQREHANLRIALEYCLSTPGEAQTGLRMAAALHFYWVDCGFVAEGRHWLDRTLALDTKPTTLRAKALFTNAHLLLIQGDNRSGLDRADECRALARQHGDETTLAYGTMMRGAAAMLGGDYALADTLLEEALAHFEALGEVTSNVILARVFRAFTAGYTGDHARAVALARQACAICEPRGEQSGYSFALYALALAEMPRGDLEQATKHARESLRLKKTFNDLLGMALVVDLLASIAAAAGHGARAAMLLGAVQQIWASIGGQVRMGTQNVIAPHQACERQARHALGDRAFQTAFDRGTELGLDEAIANALGEKPEPAIEAPAAPGTAELSLTRREHQVAELVAQGLTNKQIADRLVIAQRTAEGHVERILTKLGFAKRIQIVGWITEQRQLPAP